MHIMTQFLSYYDFTTFKPSYLHNVSSVQKLSNKQPVGQDQPNNGSNQAVKDQAVKHEDIRVLISKDRLYYPKND